MNSSSDRSSKVSMSASMRSPWLTITTDSASDLRFRDVSRLCTRFSATSAMDSPAGGRQYSGSVFLNIQLRA